MVTPKLGVASILCLNFIIWNPSVLGAGQSQSFDCRRPAPSSEGFHIINVKMDATLSYGVTMIPDMPSNPQLTLHGSWNHSFLQVICHSNIKWFFQEVHNFLIQLFCIFRLLFLYTNDSCMVLCCGILNTCIFWILIIGINWNFKIINVEILYYNLYKYDFYHNNKHLCTVNIISVNKNLSIIFFGYVEFSIIQCTIVKICINSVNTLHETLEINLTIF